MEVQLSSSEVSTSESEHDDEQIEMPLIVTREENGYELKIRMMFSSEDEAYKFYNEYAKLTISQYRRLADRTISQIIFVCGREGYRRLKDPSHVKKVKRRETRMGCPAMICFKI
ncbi:protein FAR1-RELATED SEQUENCE 6-like [Gastrolobium bilobum]|uniref:protein FAR1-RELATED SEQUENCE 6-like n=1 Tax=Gastrolobium bilobum TaxID=150636 RepID=UPI002AB12F72|nr:protein FAR1-RELATED SEQUENCE 6-like [Gastrolobium bilobum]